MRPHQQKAFKLSRDPKFLEKLTEVVGVYLTPPQNAVVLCVDEKRQIQALGRTRPGLPLKRGRCGTVTHDYKRHGTTTLFAAVQVVEGRIIGECHPRHRYQAFLQFLWRLDAEFPSAVALHLILDHYGTHGHEKVRRWLARCRRRLEQVQPAAFSPTGEKQDQLFAGHCVSLTLIGEGGSEMSATFMPTIGFPTNIGSPRVQFSAPSRKTPAMSAG